MFKCTFCIMYSQRAPVLLTSECSVSFMAESTLDTPIKCPAAADCRVRYGAITDLQSVPCTLSSAELKEATAYPEGDLNMPTSLLAPSGIVIGLDDCASRASLLLPGWGISKAPLNGCHVHSKIVDWRSNLAVSHHLRLWPHLQCEQTSFQAKHVARHVQRPQHTKKAHLLEHFDRMGAPV